MMDLRGAFQEPLSLDTRMTRSACEIDRASTRPYTDKPKTFHFSFDEWIRILNNPPGHHKTFGLRRVHYGKIECLPPVGRLDLLDQKWSVAWQCSFFGDTYNCIYEYVGFGPEKIRHVVANFPKHIHAKIRFHGHKRVRQGTKELVRFPTKFRPTTIQPVYNWVLRSCFAGEAKNNGHLHKLGLAGQVSQ